MVSVSFELEEDWSVLFNTRPLFQELEDFSDSEDIHAICSDAWDGISSCVEICVMSSSLNRSTHCVFVVLTKEDAG
jgi:hypothetical protein